MPEQVPSDTRVDIVVVGAGPIGALTAVMLARLGYEVALVDGHLEAARASGPYDLRSYALTTASCRVLNRVGVWRHVDQGRIGRFDSMVVWDGNSKGRLDFRNPGGGHEPMGTLIEHANLLRGAFDEFEGQHRVRLFNGFVNTLRSRLNDCHCVVDGGATIHCGLVIGCDGANSTVRRLAGIGSAGRDYQQQATVCNVETERPHERIARQRFLIDGPLAFLPLPAANSCAVVWTTTTEQTRRLVARDDQDFCETLGAAFDFGLGRITGTSARASFPLARAHAEHYVSDGIVLVGDAAHLIHPLAGQGLNLGILDVACLAECLAPRGSGDHAFHRAHLRRFERWRRGENLAMMFATDQINRLFRSNSTVLRRLRGTGMQMTNASGPVKRWIIARAMGDVGDLPAIARPVWDGARS